MAATIKWAWSSAISTFKMRALLHIKSSASSTNSQPTTRGRTRWEVSCAHPAAAASKKVLSAVDSGISRRVERQTTEQRADGHGCWVKGKSKVRSSDVNQEQIICTECVRVVSAPHTNTTNLFNHLKNHHKPQYDECIMAKANVTSLNLRPCPTSTQKTITATLHSATAYPSTSQRHTETTDAIAFHFAKDMCPIILWAMKSVWKTSGGKYNGMSQLSSILRLRLTYGQAEQWSRTCP